MQSIKNAWHYLLAEPSMWIFYCFFQPVRFRRDIEVPGYFKIKRIIPALRIILPLFFVYYFFTLMIWLVDIIFHDITGTINIYTSASIYLLIIFVVVIIIGSFTLGIARGIVLGASWYIAYIIRMSLYLVHYNTDPTRLIFFIVGGILFGMAFGALEDTLGDVIGNVLWYVGIFIGDIVLLIQNHNLNKFSSIEHENLVVNLISGILTAIVYLIVRKQKGPKIVKGALLWGALYGTVFAILLGIQAITSHDPTVRNLAIAYIVLGFAIFCFLSAFSYAVGYYRFLLYPFSSFSTTKAYISSQRKPKYIFHYLHQSSLYWDECVFLPLPWLKHLLLIAAKQDDNGKRAVEEIKFIMDERPQQIGAVQAVSQEIAMRYLEKCLNIQDIAQVYKHLSVILPQETRLLDPLLIKPFIPFIDASRDANRYLDPIGRKMRYKALENLTANLRKANTKTAFKNIKLNEHLNEVVMNWSLIALQEQERLSKNTPQEADQIDNPYNPGQVLKLHDNLFVGRQDLEQQLEQALSRKSRPTFLLNGERRMGKSSLLKQLPNLLGNHYLPIFYDLQMRGISSSAATFLGDIAKEIYEVMRSRGMQVEKLEYARLQEANQKNEAATYYLFEEWFKNIERVLETEDRILLLTFDEFEKLEEAVQEQYLDLHLLLDWFRSAIQNHSRLALLFSGVKNFSEMGPDWVSHFVNVKMLKVSFLQPTEAQQLILRSNDPAFSNEEIFEKSIVDEIIRVTACHPFLVQAICSTVIDNLNVKERSQADISDIVAAVKQVVEDWNGYFMDLWFRADQKQQKCLLSMESLNACSVSQIGQKSELRETDVHRTLQILLRRDLVLRNEDGTYQIAVPIFHEWVAHNCSN